MENRRYHGAIWLWCKDKPEEQTRLPKYFTQIIAARLCRWLSRIPCEMKRQFALVFNKYYWRYCNIKTPSASHMTYALFFSSVPLWLLLSKFDQFCLWFSSQRIIIYLCTCTTLNIYSSFSTTVVLTLPSLIPVQSAKKILGDIM
jgi:hypothetical protein